MKLRSLSAVGAFAVATIVMPLLASAETKFKVDPAHSSVNFKISHMGVSNVYGRFDETNGTYTLDNDDPSKSSFEIEVATKSINTHVQKRDDHLRSPDFFNAAQFPTISFKSTSVKKVDDKTMEVTGDLTLHGVTKSVTVKVEKVGEKDAGPQMGYRAGLDTTFTIKRSDFGMNFMVGPVGDEVALMVGLEGQKQ